jgi:hypothetical protein
MALTNRVALDAADLGHWNTVILRESIAPSRTAAARHGNDSEAHQRTKTEIPNRSQGEEEIRSK